MSRKIELSATCASFLQTPTHLLYLRTVYFLCNLSPLWHVHFNFNPSIKQREHNGPTGGVMRVNTVLIKMTVNAADITDDKRFRSKGQFKWATGIKGKGAGLSPIEWLNGD